LKGGLFQSNSIRANCKSNAHAMSLQSIYALGTYMSTVSSKKSQDFLKNWPPFSLSVANQNLLMANLFFAAAAGVATDVIH
jgi:hypothetical protein